MVLGDELIQSQTRSRCLDNVLSGWLDQTLGRVEPLLRLVFRRRIVNTGQHRVVASVGDRHPFRRPSVP